MPDSAERTHHLSLENLREDYWAGVLNEQNCETNPIVQFERWLNESQAADSKEPNAMTLATVSADGRPSARIVLLKEVSDTGFVFYTNYTSRKAKELETNPFCALTFWWDAVEKQVRVEGRAERISRERSDAYFRTRPKGSKLGAWASHQSEVLPSRQLLEEQLSKLEHRYAHTAEIPAPDFWGGYCVVPYTIEFWQGRPNRLHDRIRYRRSGESSWLIERLSP